MQDWELDVEAATEVMRKFGLEPPKKVEKFTTGMINDVFSIDGQYVLKVNTGHPDQAKLQREYRIYEMLQEVPMPEIVGYDGSRSILPYEYLLMEEVRGELLQRRWNGLPRSARLEWIERLGTVLAKIHSVECSSFGRELGSSGFQGQTSYKSYMEEKVRGIVDEAKKTREVEDSTLEEVASHIAGSDLFAIDTSPVLLHGNFVPGNVLVKNGNVDAVIDWEWGQGGHNQEEAAIFVYQTLDMENAFLERFKTGYEEIKSLGDRFEERIHAYNLLYYLEILPEVPRWDHRPDKQREYREQTQHLLDEVLA